MKSILITLGIIVPSLLFGQIDRSQRPKAAEAPAINFDKSEVFKTENGITVILSENHKLPKVSFLLVLDDSPKMENELAGLSEIAGSLIMSGTSNRSKDQIDAEVDYIGASLSASPNSLRFSSLTKHMDKGLSLMSDVLLNANFPQDEFDRIIKQNESGLLSTKSDAGSMARNAVSKANFEGHPYGEVMTEATLANITRQNVIDYYATKFTPKESFMVIVGDINKEQAKKAVDKYFSSWTGKDPVSEKLNAINTNSGNRVLFVKKPGAVQSVINVTFPIDITPSHPDYLKLKVLNAVLGGGTFGNRLMQNLREDKAYTYGCRSGLNINEYGSSISISGNFRNEVTDSAIVEILYELKTISNELVKDEEINLSKSSMAGGFARSLERPSTVARFALNTIKYELPADYYQSYLQKLDAITKQDLLEVAKKYLTADKCNIVVVGNEEILDKLIPFDSDGKIEKLDAFGNEVKESVAADISKEELINNYIQSVTMTSSEKELAKKMKKVKSMVEVIEVSMPQVPFPMTMTRGWVSPTTEVQKMEGQGMVFQKSFFDGKVGSTTNMQTGTKEMTAEEIASKNKKIGMFPEMNYATSGVEYELTGIEIRNGVECYVLKTMDGQSESYDYYEKTSFNKIESVTVEEAEGQTQETTTTYSDFKEQDGFIFPNTINITMGPANFSGKVTSRTINGEIDLKDYK